MVIILISKRSNELQTVEIRIQKNNCKILFSDSLLKLKNSVLKISKITFKKNEDF